jgi:tetratricopeptide (TPR) repeat protein
VYDLEKARAMKEKATEAFKIENF